MDFPPRSKTAGVKVSTRRGDVVLVIESSHFPPRSKTTGRPKSPPQFVIRNADGGYSAFLSLPKEQGNQTKSKDTRDNRYCCFLTPDEFERAKGYGFDGMADFTLAKIETRRAPDDADQGKLDTLVSLITDLIEQPPIRSAAV